MFSENLYLPFAFFGGSYASKKASTRLGTALRVLSGYLKGRSSPPQNAQLPPPPEILLSLQYISDYIQKIIKTRRG